MPIDRNTGLWVANGGNSSGGGGGSSKSNPIKDLLLYGDYDDTFSVFEKGTVQEVVEDGDGWSIDSPLRWYFHTDNWKIAEVDTTNAIDNYKRIYFRVKLKGGTSYLMGQGYNHLVNDTVYDGKIVLFDINGNELTSNDHAHKEINGEVFQDCVEYTPSADGVYILACGSFTTNGRSGKFPVCCYPAPEKDGRTNIIPTSSGFDEFGEPIKYNSAEEAGISPKGS